MKPIKLNMATFEYQDVTISYPMLLISAVIIVSLSLYTLGLAFSNQDAIFDYEQKMTVLNEKTITRQKIEKKKTHRISKEESTAIQQEAGFINHLILMDIFPWGRLLDDLERALPSTTTVVSFASGGSLDKISIRGKADTMQEVSNFMENLEKSHFVMDTTLRNLEVSQDRPVGENRDRELTIQFELESTVVPNAFFAGMDKGKP